MRTVAILGRPNVGKSTLFNRLVGRRRALVHDLPGVTRDRIDGRGRLYELRFRVIDTAGIELGAPEESLPARLARLSLQGLEEADVGLFLIDARAGVTALDREIAALLRRQAKPVLLLANKCEGRAGGSGLAEAFELGLGEPIAISAEHGEGLVELADALRPLLAEPAGEAACEGEPVPADGAAPPTASADEGGDAAEEEAQRGPLRLAVVGRPNVGKSSLINALLRSERLLTGPEPGLTRDAVRIAWEWQGRAVELVDTAGLRKKARIEAPLEKLSASATIRAIREADVVLLLLDAERPLEHQDATIAERAIEEGKALVLAVNKWDLVAEPQALLAELRARIAERLDEVKGIQPIPISAKTGRNLDRLLPAVVEAFRRWSRRVPTAKLNRWLPAMLEAHPPPMVEKKRVKLRYVTQVATRPPTFALFGNRPAEHLPKSYLRYLANGLRQAFGLEGTVLRFHVRSSENPYAEERAD
ncbi:MAG: ribosome biogenesis GTPase Der [Geminicoccaceae bacterium]|nr:ribosome biogenesis GTPase Der [Geminicoccaceae bacterium]